MNLGIIEVLILQYHTSEKQTVGRVSGQCTPHQMPRQIHVPDRITALHLIAYFHKQNSRSWYYTVGTSVQSLRLVLGH